MLLLVIAALDVLCWTLVMQEINIVLTTKPQHFYSGQYVSNDLLSIQAT